MKGKYHWVGSTEAQKAELWERLRKGESLKAVGPELPGTAFADDAAKHPVGARHELATGFGGQAR
jgi:hypothetical protein